MLRSRLFGETVSITRETARTSQKKAYYNNHKLLQYLPDFRYRDMRDTISFMAAAFINDEQQKN